MFEIQNVKCELVEETMYNIVASGILTMDNIVCHGVEMGTNNGRVFVDVVIDLSALLHVPSLGIAYVCET